MRITWEVDDGYAGGSAPHHTTIPDEDLEDLTPKQQEDVINDYVQSDFDQNIHWYITSREKK